MFHLRLRRAVPAMLGAALAALSMARPTAAPAAPARALPPDLYSALAHGLIDERVEALNDELVGLERRFGPQLLPLFQLAGGYVNFNHGSFGSTPREVSTSSFLVGRVPRSEDRVGVGGVLVPLCSCVLSLRDACVEAHKPC
jgi:hypothetical protein